MNKEFSWMMYLMLLTVVVMSFAITYLLPVSDFFKGISTIPGIGALSLAVIQLWRDKINHERQKELQRKQHFFNLGVTSHMAKVAFDKHVEFCEEYITRIDQGLPKLFREGPTKDTISLAVELSSIRSKFRTWLTEDIIAKVKPYEKALTSIAADDTLLEHLGIGDRRNKVVDRMFHTFSEVTGMKEKFIEEDINEEIAPEKIINHLQQVLGIQELTKLRQKIIKESIASLS